MARGRPRIPEEEKKLRGTYRKDRDPSTRANVPALAKGATLEPAPSPVSYAPSSPLDEDEMAVFQNVVEDMQAARTLSPIYRRLITQLARLEVRAAKMRRSLGNAFVKRAPDETGKKQLESNPALSQLHQLEAQIFRHLTALGLTPESAVRVPKTKDEDNGTEENEFAAFRPR